MTTDGMIRVAIGLIERDGRYLIRQRPDTPGSPMPGLWEFPGGKCEPGESPENAVIRECLEETGLHVCPVFLRKNRQHTYPHGRVDLHYFDCRTIDPVSQPSESTGFRWVEAEEFALLPFPDANEPILRELAQTESPRDV